MNPTKRGLRPSSPGMSTEIVRFLVGQDEEKVSYG